METEQQQPEGQTNFRSPSELQQYKLRYDALLMESEQDFQEPNVLEFFVLSKTFLKEWNEFIGFESGAPDFTKHPGDFNVDLLESLQETKKYMKLPSQIIMKKGLQNKIDYELINGKLMEFFEKDFGGVKIPRKAYQQADGSKFVEVYLKEINAVFITHPLLVEMDKRQRHELIVDKLQCSSQTPIGEVKETLLKIINKKDFGMENLRLWKISSELDQFFKETQKICNDTRSVDYEIPVKGIFLEKKLEVKLEDFAFSDNDILMVEVRENSKNWNFVQEGIPSMKKCGFCSKFTDNVLWCACEKVYY